MRVPRFCFSNGLTFMLSTLVCAEHAPKPAINILALQATYTRAVHFCLWVAKLSGGEEGRDSRVSFCLWLAQVRHARLPCSTSQRRHCQSDKAHIERVKKFHKYLRVCVCVCRYDSMMDKDIPISTSACNCMSICEHTHSQGGMRAHTLSTHCCIFQDAEWIVF